MRKLRIDLLPHNPNAAYLTSRGWKLPDGSFKPHNAPKPVAVVQERGFIARVFGR